MCTCRRALLRPLLKLLFVAAIPSNARDFEIVMVNSLSPFGNGHLLPRWGLLAARTCKRWRSALCLMLLKAARQSIWPLSHDSLHAAPWSHSII